MNEDGVRDKEFRYYLEKLEEKESELHESDNINWWKYIKKGSKLFDVFCKEEKKQTTNKKGEINGK